LSRYTNPLRVLHKQHLGCVCLMDPSIHPSREGWMTLQAISGAPGTLYLQERQLPGTRRSRALDSGVAVPEPERERQPERDPFPIHHCPPTPCIVIHEGQVDRWKDCRPLAEDPEKEREEKVTWRRASESRAVAEWISIRGTRPLYVL